MMDTNDSHFSTKKQKGRSLARKVLRGLSALVLALLLPLGLWLSPLMPPPAPDRAPALRPLRVWCPEGSPALLSWLKKQAAAYEKKTGSRVYLRMAGKAEQELALNGMLSGPAPDLLLFSDAGDQPQDALPVALRGYALILRDDTAPKATPVPKSLLFFRPTFTPGPPPTPAPLPDLASLPPILTPPGLSFPGSHFCPSPLAALQSGTGRAALLQPSEARQLSFGYAAFPAPENARCLSFFAHSFSPAGLSFYSFLISAPAQQALSNFQLFSPFFPLYGPDQPLPSLIDGSLPRFPLPPS